MLGECVAHRAGIRSLPEPEFRHRKDSTHDPHPHKICHMHPAHDCAYMTTSQNVQPPLKSHLRRLMDDPLGMCDPTARFFTDHSRYSFQHVQSEAYWEDSMHAVSRRPHVINTQHSKAPPSGIKSCSIWQGAPCARAAWVGCQSLRAPIQIKLKLASSRETLAS